MELLNLQTFLVMGIALSVVMPAVWLFLEKKDRKDKAEGNFGAALYLKKEKKNYPQLLYRVLSGFPLTAGLIRRIRRRYEIITPESPAIIETKTLKLAGITTLLGILQVVMVFLLGPSPHNFVLALYLIFVIDNEVINYFVITEEIKLLDEIEGFVTRVGDNYFNRYHIDDAILDAIDSRMSEGMKAHAKLLYEIVTSDTIKDDVARYNQAIHNKYLKMFLSLCVNILENGDKELNGQGLLTQNLLNLKKEINLEYLKQKKLRYIFSGSVFVAVVVCVPITWIQKFGISIAPELEAMYQNRFGILYIGLIFLVSALVYVMINHAKEVRRPQLRSYTYLKKLEAIPVVKAALDNLCGKLYPITTRLRDMLKRLGESITAKQLILKSMLTALLAFTLSAGLFFYIHANGRQLITGKVTDSDILAYASTAQMSDVIKEVILDYTNRYKEDEKIRTAQAILPLLQNDGRIYNAALREKLAAEIADRITAYRNEYFKWYDLLVCIGVGAVALCIPYLMLLYRNRLLKDTMADEVTQFDSIIYMLMYSDYVTVMDILEQMELFAVVFKPSLRECINEYNSGDLEALQKLKDRESYEPFRRVADSLIRCDEIAISEAFNKLEADRENYYERRKQENEITIQKRADNIQPLAWLPGALVIIYLIVPLLYISMQSLLELRTMIQEMGVI